MRRTTAAAVTAVALILGTVALTLPSNQPKETQIVAQPGILSSQIPPGEDFQQRQIKDLQRDLRELGPSIMHSFQSVVDRLDAADATLAAQDATLTTQQATLTTQQATLTANVASINTLITQVVKPQEVYAFGQGFALPMSDVVVLTKTITVPAGYTSAVVSVVGRLFAYNPNASYDYLTGVSQIAGGAGSAALPVLVGASGGSGMCVSPFSKVLPSLTPGGTFNITLTSKAVWAAWAANPNNTAELSGSILWVK